MNGTPISATLHVFVAFDWGDEIRLENAQKLLASASFQELARRRRTPTSFTFRPAPLHLDIGDMKLSLHEAGEVVAPIGLTLFDFGAVSAAIRVPLSLTPNQFLQLAGALADPGTVTQAVRTILKPIYRMLLPCILDAAWEDDFSEEYFVFQFAPENMPLAGDSAWLAGMVHLEAGPLSQDEAAEAIRMKITYGPDDLCIPDWTAAVLFDRDCDETLQAIAFANLQLLEFRHIDHRLDQSVADASKILHPLTRSSLPFWRIHARPLRQLGDLKVEANSLFERTSNALKLVGDSYLARVYRLLASRFHLDTWEENILRKLEVAEGVYQVVSDQAAAFRGEFLEAVVVVLILVEIVLAFVKH